MGKRKKFASSKQEEVLDQHMENVTNSFYEIVEANLKQCRFKELVEIYYNFISQENEGKHLVGKKALEEIQRRNPRWIPEVR